MAHRILLVDPTPRSRDALSNRLRVQGFEVTTASDGAEAAHFALGDPPAAVIADLWMPSISGVQLCRLLKAEPATVDVPVILRGAEGRRERFWAERAGAMAYVVKGRMGDLVRVLARATAEHARADFFTVLADDGADVRDRIAAHLDAALFDSVIAAEVRNLAVCESFERLFDRFAQFASEVAAYRWLALYTATPARLGLHTSPGARELAEREALEALGVGASSWTVAIEDDDAVGDAPGPEAVVRAITFGDARVGLVGMAPHARNAREIASLLDVFGRELGGPVRIAMLVEESRRLAMIDPLTGLHNRRSFAEGAAREVARSTRHGEPLSLLLFDLDHFKQINDHRGHASGDRVLQALGQLLSSRMRRSDLCARWGGEEFVVMLPHTNLDQGSLVAERLRDEIAHKHIEDEAGERIRVTVSIGVAQMQPGEALDAFVDRTDRAMYAAKTQGRNRVCKSDPRAVRSAAPDADVVEASPCDAAHPSEASTATRA